MGKSYSVVTSDLEKASKEIKKTSETYTELYSQLFDKVGTLGEAWKGDDNLKFVEQINGFCQELKDMSTKLDTVSQTLSKIKQNYDDQEQRNIQGVSKLAN